MAYNPQKAFIAYIRDFITQFTKTRKGRIVVGVIFIAILGISYFIPKEQLANNRTSTSQSTSITQGNEYNCRLLHIADGDTINADCSQYGAKDIRIRIWGIDAPELSQKPWGYRSKDALIKLLPTVKNGTITLRINDIDQYGRYVAQIFVNGQDIGLEMVKQGEAVVYHHFNNLPQYRSAEQDAKKAKRGIWQESGAQQDPGRWRKLNPR